MPKKKRGDVLDTPLARAFNFTRADLQDNQQGFISRRQKRRLLTVLRIGTGLAALLCLILIRLLIGQISNPESGWLFNGIMAFLLLGFIAGLIGVGWLSWQELLGDIRANHIETLEGTIKPLTLGRSRTKTQYFITIDEQALTVTQKQQNAFEKEQAYRLYIAPNSRKILSAEIVSEAENEN